MAEVLRRDPHHVIYLKWSYDGNGFKKTFGFVPKQVVDLQTITNRLKIPSKFDATCAKVTGGPFCCRASYFSNICRPSEDVLEHHAAKTCVVYVFGVEEEKIVERLSSIAHTRASEMSLLGPGQPHVNPLSMKRSDEKSDRYNKMKEVKSHRRNRNEDEQRRSRRRDEDEQRRSRHRIEEGQRRGQRDNDDDAEVSVTKKIRVSDCDGRQRESRPRRYEDRRHEDRDRKERTDSECKNRRERKAERRDKEREDSKLVKSAKDGKERAGEKSMEARGWRMDGWYKP